MLKKAFGTITYAEFDFKSYDQVLSKASVSEAIYSGAYIMPSGSAAFGTTRKHRAHLKLLMQMMEDEVALRIAGTKSMLEVFTLLRSYPMIGDFLAYQYATDLNYSTLTNFSEMEFVVPGPGAKGGISKCFESLGGLSESDLIRVVTEQAGGGVRSPGHPVQVAVGTTLCNLLTARTSFVKWISIRAFIIPKLQAAPGGPGSSRNFGPRTR